jgi:hypothetical protein
MEQPVTGEAGGARNRRRIDRVTAPGYLDGLQERRPDELRAMRDECQAEEVRLSYVRRLVQGKLDIARAEAARRAGADAGAGELVAALPTIFADAPAADRGIRAVSVYQPDDEARRSDELPLDDAVLGRIPDLDDEELAGVIERLADEERRLSSLRATLLRHLDRVKEELVRRYREGEIALEDVVSSSMWGAWNVSGDGENDADGVTEP